MPTLTAIEFGADSCVLVKAAVRGTDVRVAGVEILDPVAFPGTDAFVAALRQVRQKRGLPRKARIVLWGLPAGATGRDAAAAALLAPLKNAGFRIDRVVSPGDALAALARLRRARQEGGVGWLAVNRSAVAIAIARPGELLYQHAFSWDSSVGATGSQARMLQRYSLVAFLAPEIRRGIDAAREKKARVVALVTCGNFPDLRSLTMPLIEELDVEVETLDSLDGLDVKPSIADTLADSAPAIRVACAGAVAREPRRHDRPPRQRTRAMPFLAAAVVLAAAGVAWLWFGGRGPAAVPAAKPAAPPVSAAAARQQPQPRPAQPAPSAQPKPVTPAPPQSAAPASPPAAKRTVPPPAPALPAAPVPAQRPTAQAAPSQPSSPPPARVAPPAGRGATPPAAAEPLPDPLPRVTTILVSPERRFVMLEGGRVVSVGDKIGQRVVVSIEPRALVLKEPSGLYIRVGLGGRRLGVERRR